MNTGRYSFPGGGEIRQTTGRVEDHRHTTQSMLVNEARYNTADNNNSKPLLLAADHPTLKNLLSQYGVVNDGRGAPTRGVISYIRTSHGVKRISGKGSNALGQRYTLVRGHNGSAVRRCIC